MNEVFRFCKLVGGNIVCPAYLELLWLRIWSWSWEHISFHSFLTTKYTISNTLYKSVMSHSVKMKQCDSESNLHSVFTLDDNQFHDSSTQGQEGQGQSSETGHKPAGGGGGERRRRRKPVLKELSGYDVEEGAGKAEYPLSHYSKPAYILVQSTTAPHQKAKTKIHGISMQLPFWKLLPLVYVQISCSVIQIVWVYHVYVSQKLCSAHTDLNLPHYFHIAHFVHAAMCV